MRRRTLVASLVVWVCSLLLAALLSPSPGRAFDGSNLLQNPGFEEGTSGWLSGPSAAFVVTDTAEYVHSGIWAASLNKEVGAVPIYIYQDVPVVGGGYYTLSGWVYYYKEDSLIEDWAMLRIDWRNSQGSLLTVDSQKVYGDEPGYHERRIPYDGSDSVQAPAAATIARIKCMAHIPDSETPVFFDELSFTFQGLSSKVYLPLVVKNY